MMNVSIVVPVYNEQESVKVFYMSWSLYLLMTAAAMERSLLFVSCMSNIHESRPGFSGDHRGVSGAHF